VSTRISKVEVYAADLRNQPGMLARVLEALANAGADLEFIVARRVTGNTARVFMAPLKGARQLRAAADVDVRKAVGMHALRIEAADRPGFGAALTRRLADAGLNLRGLSAARIGRKSVTYVAFESTEAADQAAKITRKLLATRRR
jgi:hypothetical protein